MSSQPLLTRVTIDSLGPRGEGIVSLSSIKGNPVIEKALPVLKNKETLPVPFALSDEVVDIEIKHKTRTALYGKLHKIIKASPERINAPCPHFGTCGGCALQHYSDSAYKAYKKSLVTNALANHNIEAVVEDPVIVGSGQRRRIDFMARKWDGDVKMGFHEAESKKPFNVETCPLVHPDIPPLFAPLRTLITPILESERLIHFFITRAENGLDILLAGFKNALLPEHEKALAKFASDHNILRLAYKVKKKEKILHITAQPTVRFGAHDVEVTAYGFLQATKASDQIFGDFLKDYFSGDSLKVADLFCGRGTLSLALTKLGHAVTGIECDGQALTALKKVDEPKLTIQERNLFESPVTSKELNAFDGIVMNPPRAGAETQTLEVAKSDIKNLVYISCNADSFARDSKELLDAGFTLQRIVPVDQFMWTPHIEVMAYFERT